MDNYILATLALPLLGFLFIGMFGKYISHAASGAIGTLVVFASFCTSVLLFMNFDAEGEAYILHLYNWFTIDGIPINFDLQIDQLSLVMMLIITGIGALIHLYSIGYMKGDKGFARFFSYMNLFVFAMLLLVMGSNYLLLYIGWEGVAVASYLLIGFWYNNEEYGKAARKAFIMNRIGDLGLLVGVMVLAYHVHAIDYLTVAENANKFEYNSVAITFITLSLFFGATGKSAQVPLFTWLPDAMAGPTPISALIHAATMVTAGVYLVVRSNFLFTAAPITLDVILYIGLITSLVAGFIALRQNDIKKVLAYSTVSQLGFMFIAVGAGAYIIAIFHLMTHAFFKALLFLGSGSVIHAMGGEQDMRFMGGLKNKIPVTFWTFLIATFAISGFPFFSGMISKDEILGATFAQNPVLWGFTFLSAAITVIYMFRAVYLTFFGSFRGSEEQAKHLHESPLNMTLPLVVLAVLSIFGGFLNLPHYIAHGKWEHLTHWLDKTIVAPVEIPEVPLNTEYMLIGATVLMFFVLWFWVRNTYLNKKKQALATEDYKGWEKASAHKLWFDEAYHFLFVGTAEGLGKIFAYFDKHILEPFTNFIGDGAEESGDYFKKFQNGNVETYVLVMSLAIGIILIFNFYLTK